MAKLSGQMLDADFALEAAVITLMKQRKYFSPKDLAEQYRQLKTLQAQVAKAELSASQKSEDTLRRSSSRPDAPVASGQEKQRSQMASVRKR
jgi:hypothetical protein